MDGWGGHGGRGPSAWAAETFGASQCLSDASHWGF